MEKIVSIKRKLHFVTVLVVVFTFGICSYLIYADSNKSIIRDYSNVNEDGWKYIRLFDTDRNYEFIAITGYVGKRQDHIVIPGKIDGVSVRVLNGHLFDYGYECSSITIPWEVEEIQGNTFECVDVDEIVFESGSRLKSLAGSNAFGFSGITKLELPEYVECIGKNTFMDATYLKELSIGPNVKEIGEGAFYYTKISNIVVDKDNERFEFKDGMLIEKRTNKLLAYGYDKAEKEAGKVYIPDYIEEIDPRSIPINAKWIEVDKKNNSYSSYNGCLYSKDRKTLYRVPEKMKSEELKFNDKVTTIERYAFQYCMNYETIKIPDTVKDIEMFAFNKQKLYISKTLQFADLQTFVGEIYFEGNRRDWDKIDIVNAQPEVTLTYDLIFMEE